MDPSLKIETTKSIRQNLENYFIMISVHYGEKCSKNIISQKGVF